MTCRRCGKQGIAVSVCSTCVLELSYAWRDNTPLRRPTRIGRFLHALCRRHDYAWTWPGVRVCVICYAHEHAPLWR
jgi:hypothetical protein